MASSGALTTTGALGTTLHPPHGLPSFSLFILFSHHSISYAGERVSLSDQNFTGIVEIPLPLNDENFSFVFGNSLLSLMKLYSSYHIL